jgi:exonuclease I
MVVSDPPEFEDRILTLLALAEIDTDATLDAFFDDLDARHHTKWANAQATHLAENRQLVDYRIESLTASHRARRAMLDDQLARATNERIRVMKRSEIARADADFQRHLDELERAAGAGDIHATLVLLGTLRITAA